MIKRILTLCLILEILLLPQWFLRAADKAEPVKYEPTVESLRKAQVPEWFIDGKLGIFMHWGPESIPGAASTWYARWMYEEGSEGYKFHCATYGHPSKFGYKDICKLFKAPKFDQAQADRLVKLYKQAHACYVVPVASHHDNFDMWDSKFQPRWNSMATAGKDVCGMWQKATVANGLHFGVASHVARTFRWLQTSHGADKTGPLAGVPYDGQDPAYADLYGVPWKSTDPGYEGPQDVGPPAFEQNFEDRMNDLIDKYHPDLYYTDGGPPFKDKGYKIVAHLYNENMKLHGGKLQAVANFKGGCPIGAENFEFEFPATAQPHPWQTDKTMSPEWYWLRNQTNHYRKGFEIVHTLIDVVSKNGNLLLNVPLTGDGELEDATINMLKDMGHDFDLIGEAIFSTRPWETFGEGKRNFNNISHGSATDIRFTRNKANNVLYVTTLGWPGDGAVVTIRTMGKARIDLKSLKSVTLVGTKEKLGYRQDTEFLQITLPAKAPYECSAYSFKLTFSDKIPKLKPESTLLWQGLVRDVSGTEDRSMYGLPGECGVLLIDVPSGSNVARAGLKNDDVIIGCNGTEVKTVADLRAVGNKAAGNKLTLAVIRKQKQAAVELSDYLYVVQENIWPAEFKVIPLAPASAILPMKAFTGGSGAGKESVDVLVDGKITRGQGLTFQNGVDDALIKFDMGTVKEISQINTYASGNTRARQSFTLYGSSATADPGWKVTDRTVFTPVIKIDSRGDRTEYEATSIRRSDGKPVGSYRWLVWVGSPTMGEIGGQNTTFEEMQVTAGK